MTEFDANIHEFTDPRTGRTRYCVGYWNAREGTLGRPLDGRERALNPGCTSIQVRGRSPEGMAYLGSLPSRKAAEARARRLYGHNPIGD